MPVGAIVGGGIIAGAGSYLGGQKQADAAGAAAAQSAAAAAQARADLAGFRLPGQSAMYSLADLFGLDRGGAGPTGQPFTDLSGFENSPGYKFTQQQAIRGLELSNASKGLLKSGANLTGIQNTAAGLASQTFNNYVSQLMGQAGIGAQAAGGSASAGLQGAQLSNQALMAQGAANASSIVGPANILSNALGQYAGASNLYGGSNNLWASSYLNPNMGMSYPSAAAQGAPSTWSPAPRMAAHGGRFDHGETAIVGDQPMKQNMSDDEKMWYMRMLQDRFGHLDRQQDMDRQTVDDMEVVPPYRPTFEDRWPRPEEQFRTPAYNEGGHIPRYAEGGPVSPGLGMVGDLPSMGNIFGSMLNNPNGLSSQLSPYLDLASKSGLFPSSMIDTTRGVLNDPNVLTANPFQTMMNYAESQSQPMPNATSTPNTMPTTPGLNFPPQLMRNNNDLWGGNSWGGNNLSNPSGSSYQGGFEAGGRVRQGSATVGETRPEIFLPDDPDNPAHVVGRNGPEVRQFDEPGTVLPNEAFDPRVQDVFERGAARTRARYPNVGSTNSPLERFARSQNDTSMIDTLSHAFLDPIPEYGDIEGGVDRALPLAALGTGSPMLRGMPKTPGIELGTGGGGFLRRMFGQPDEMPIRREPTMSQAERREPQIGMAPRDKFNEATRQGVTNSEELSKMTGMPRSQVVDLLSRDELAKIAMSTSEEAHASNPLISLFIRTTDPTSGSLKIGDLKAFTRDLSKDQIQNVLRRLNPEDFRRYQKSIYNLGVRDAGVRDAIIPETAPGEISAPSGKGALGFWEELNPQSYTPPEPLGVPDTPPPSVVRRRPAPRRVAPVADEPVNDLAPASTMSTPEPIPELSRLDKMRAIAAAGVVRPGPNTIARRSAANLPPLGPPPEMAPPARPRMLESSGPDLSGNLSPEELAWMKRLRGYADGGRPMPGAPSMVGDQPGMPGGLPMTPGLGMIAGRTVPGSQLPGLTAAAAPQSPDAMGGLSQLAQGGTQPPQNGFDPRMMMPPPMPTHEPDKTFDVLLNFSRRLNSLNQVGR